MGQDEFNVKRANLDGPDMHNELKKVPLDRDGTFDQLRHYAALVTADPQINSVFRLAQDYFFALSRKEIDIDDLSRLACVIGEHLFTGRASALAAQHGLDESVASDPFRAGFDKLAQSGFEAYREAIESSSSGIVFTAHPTFVANPQVRRALAAKASGEAARHVAGDLFTHEPVTLENEHSEAQSAIANAKAALRACVRSALDIAEQSFPDSWRTLRPLAPTVASWVGYDLDGRDDINWWTTLSFRLHEKADQLSSYAQQIEQIPVSKTDNQLTALTQQLRAAADLTAAQASAFEKDLSDLDQLIAAANLLTEDHSARITSLDTTIKQLEENLHDCPPKDAKDIIALISEMRQCGLGTARIHLRINSVQIQTVIRRDLGVLTEDRNLGRVALDTLAERIKTSPQIRINFADLFIEQSTARRQFMLCAQILKHIDADTPIRFLIAESENPATVLGALYLAHQYGVAEKLDISPLFETPEALENGGRFIERLLRVPAFIDYVNSREQLSVQLGFSDAGRFIGQIAADMAIERIHNLIAAALADKAENVKLLFFNTHGESVGRGGYPGSFQQRLKHLLSDWTLKRCARRNIHVIHETSFQGGDGYLHFGTKSLARTAVKEIVTRDLSPDRVDHDAFYSETSLVWDFYRALRQWHETYFSDPDYAILLSDFGGGFRLRAGSRPQRRASGPPGPRSLRAISHNATLQQLGVLANTACGIGSALARETDELARVANASPRFRQLIDLAVTARVRTSIPVLRAYAEVYSPSFWVSVSKQSEAELRQARVRIAEQLSERETHAAMTNCANKLSIDLGRFDGLISKLERAPSIGDRHSARLPLHALHAIRQAAMLWAFEIAGRLPAFSARRGFQSETVQDLIFEMQIERAARMLQDVFPVHEIEDTRISDLTELRDSGEEGQRTDYQRLNEAFIEPLLQIDILIKKITLAVAHAHGAYG